MSNSPILKSSIAKKIAMALSGLFLVTFLSIHFFINLTSVFNEDLFNILAHFMGNNPLIQFAMQPVLILGVLFHFIMGFVLDFKNRASRPIGYAKIDGAANSSWYSRSMGILGSLLLIFLVVHLAHFWVDTKVAVFSGKADEHNTFLEMKKVFSHWWIVLLYTVGVISLLYHLLHGFQSAFQTLGLNHKKYTPSIKRIGIWFSIIICLLFASMPIVMYFDVI